MPSDPTSLGPNKNRQFSVFSVSKLLACVYKRPQKSALAGKELTGTYLRVTSSNKSLKFKPFTTRKKQWTILKGLEALILH